MRLTPIRCDMCGKLGYIEEASFYLMKIKGLSSWIKNEELELDICASCREKLLSFINKEQEKRGGRDDL